MTTPRLSDLLETDDVWFQRERSKYWQNAPVWFNEPFWLDGQPTWDFHCPHVSQADPAMLAYTPSLEYGRADRQVRLKPGRYLAKYFGDVLTPKQIQFYAQWWATGSKPVAGRLAKAELRFATTADEIVHVYDTGPRSCMSGDNFSRDDNPTRVYAAGDLAISYLLVPNGKAPGEDWICARALTWPEKKVFGRVYPNDYTWQSDGFESPQECSDAIALLFNRLKADGYTSIGEGGSFNGAKIEKQETSDGCYVMPYLDNNYGVDDAGSFWVMSRNGEHQCDRTDGELRMEEENDDPTCEYCEETFDETDGGTAYRNWSSRLGAVGQMHICGYCSRNETFYCEGSGENYITDRCETIQVDGETFHRDWAEANGYYFSDYSETWFFEQGDAQAVMSDGTVCSQSEKDEVEPETDDGDGADDSERVPGYGTTPNPYRPAPTIEDARQVEFAV